MTRINLVARGATVEPPLSGWEFDNLPSGMTLAYDETWSATTVPVAWSIAPRTTGTDPVMVTGQSPPSGDTYVVRHTYDGVADGQEPNFVYRSTAGVDEVFYGFTLKFGSAWAQPVPSGIKFLIISGEGAPSGFAGWVDVWNAETIYGGASLPYFRFTTDSSTTTPTGRTQMTTLDNAAATLALDTWHKVEVLLRKGGAGDCCKLWINDTLVVDTDVNYSGSFAWLPALQFGGELQQVGTWGGGVGVTGGAGHVVYFDRTALWRRV